MGQTIPLQERDRQSKESRATGDLVRERILELCDERDISINKLGEISGVTQSTLNNIVNGRSKNPTVTTVQKLCDGLRINLYDFFNTSAFRKHNVKVRKTKKKS